MLRLPELVPPWPGSLTPGPGPNSGNPRGAVPKGALAAGPDHGRRLAGPGKPCGPVHPHRLRRGRRRAGDLRRRVRCRRVRHRRFRHRLRVTGGLERGFDRDGHGFHRRRRGRLGSCGGRVRCRAASRDDGDGQDGEEKQIGASHGARLSGPPGRAQAGNTSARFQRADEVSNRCRSSAESRAASRSFPSAPEIPIRSNHAANSGAGFAPSTCRI